MIPLFYLKKIPGIQPNCSENIVFFDEKIFSEILNKLIILGEIQRVFLRVEYSPDFLDRKSTHFFNWLLGRETIDYKKVLNFMKEYTVKIFDRYLKNSYRDNIYLLYPEAYIEVPLEKSKDFLYNFIKYWRKREGIENISLYFLDRQNVPLFCVILYGYSVMAGEEDIKDLYIEELEGFSDISWRTFFIFRRAIKDAYGMWYKSENSLLDALLDIFYFVGIPLRDVGRISDNIERLGDKITIVENVEKAVRYFFSCRDHLFIIKLDDLDKIKEKLLKFGYIQLKKEDERIYSKHIFYHKEMGNAIVACEEINYPSDPKKVFLDRLIEFINILPGGRNLLRKKQRFIKIRKGISRELLEFLKDSNEEELFENIYPAPLDLFGIMFFRKKRRLYMFYLDMLENLIEEIFHEKKVLENNFDRDK